ncbi:MAG: hypothetical protein QOH07_1967, partial [Mycobacterium sp.]|nr:hypothetical protein [Mycobacterium sp.]
MNDVDIAVLVFGEDGVPGPLRGLSA